mmetsp:Transcript_115630/g.360152  ORF Transcript_115630/g.360152 Transcript_115630/m.360152 type:complete len:607 (-) Transcript_115630:347-2167(-)
MEEGHLVLMAIQRLDVVEDPADMAQALLEVGLPHSQVRGAGPGFFVDLLRVYLADLLPQVLPHLCKDALIEVVEEAAGDLATELLSELRFEAAAMVLGGAVQLGYVHLRGLRRLGDRNARLHTQKTTQSSTNHTALLKPPVSREPMAEDEEASRREQMDAHPLRREAAGILAPRDGGAPLANHGRQVPDLLENDLPERLVLPSEPALQEPRVRLGHALLHVVGVSWVALQRRVREFQWVLVDHPHMDQHGPELLPHPRERPRGDLLDHLQTVECTWHFAWSVPADAPSLVPIHGLSGDILVHDKVEHVVQPNKTGICGELCPHMQFSNAGHFGQVVLIPSLRLILPKESWQVLQLRPLALAQEADSTVVLADPRELGLECQAAVCRLEARPAVRRAVEPLLAHLDVSHRLHPFLYVALPLLLDVIGVAPAELLPQVRELHCVLLLQRPYLVGVPSALADHKVTDDRLHLVDRGNHPEASADILVAQGFVGHQASNLLVKRRSLVDRQLPVVGTLAVKVEPVLPVLGLLAVDEHAEEDGAILSGVSPAILVQLRHLGKLVQLVVEVVHDKRCVPLFRVDAHVPEQLDVRLRLDALRRLDQYHRAGRL